MKLSSLLSALPTPFSLSSDPEISEICIHSEDASPGALFLAIRGLHHDSHTDLSAVVQKGCTAAVVEADYDGADHAMQLIRVHDTRAALSLLCNHLYNDPGKELSLVLVTGTAGKTSVCYMLRSIFRTAGIPSETVGTVSGTLTTPDPPDLYRILRKEADKGTKALFLEASSHALALRKLLPLRPAYGIFTNLSHEHLDFHQTMDAYLAAKATLFKQCSVGIFNADDPFASTLIRSATCRVVRYSAFSDDADFTARNITQLGTTGIRYDCLTENRLFRIQSPIPGRFSVYNTLAAVACAYHAGISPDCIRYALRGMSPIPGRLERISLPSRLFSVYLDFAHTPDALENVLSTLRGFLPQGGRLTVLFGCGGDRDRSKRPLMGAIAAKLADFVIVTSDNSRSEKPSAIIDDILQGIPPETPHTVIPKRADAIRYAILTALPGDILLLAGKGHEAWEIDRNGKHPFSEQAIVREAWQERFGTS